MAGAKSAKAKGKAPSKPAKTARRPATAKPVGRTVAKSKPPARPAAAPKRQAPAKPALKANFGLDRLQQVALTATNLEASISFYRDTLGLRFVARYDPPGLAFFNLGHGLRLLLSAGVSNASLYFQVDDIDTALKELRKRGVQFLQPPHLIHRDEAGDFGKKGTEEWMAFFHDPGGNLLALVERRQ